MKVRYGLLTDTVSLPSNVAMRKPTPVVRHTQLEGTWLIALAFMAWTVVLCNAASNISAGEQIRLHSEILGEDRTVFVAVPASYLSGAERYPVLYLTDAQWNFEQARASIQYLARNQIIPEMLVVGVVNRDRTRDLYATRADFRNGDRVIPFPTSGNPAEARPVPSGHRGQSLAGLGRPQGAESTPPVREVNTTTTQDAVRHPGR